MRILIVDDHELMRRGVRSLLHSQAGWEIVGEAVDGRDAIEKAQQLNPDLIVMDVSMPSMNGLEATREILRSNPQIKILILSQHESSQIIQQAFKAGARGYVVKSSVTNDLMAAVEKVIQNGSLFGDAQQKFPDTHVDAQEVLQRSAALEQALRDSEEQFRSTFELAAIGVGHLAPDGRWIRVNRKLSEILGYTPTELVKMRYQDITHPDDLRRNVDFTETLLSGLTEQYSMEKRYIRGDSSAVWVNLTTSAVRDSRGRVKYFISIVEDITDRKKTDEVRAQLAAIVESSDDAIISKDLSGVITGWNPGARRIFGYSAEEAIGQPVMLLIPAELRDEEREILRRLKCGERIDHYETVRVAKNGNRLNVSLTVSPIKDSSGKIVGASKIARDITERKNAEVPLQESQERTQFSLQAVNVGTWEWDLTANSVQWLQNLERVHGKERGTFQATFESAMNGVHPDDRERVQRLVERAVTGNGEYLAQYRQYRADGTVCWREASGQVLFDAQGRPVRMRGICMDISDRKQAEE